LTHEQLEDDPVKEMTPNFHSITFDNCQKGLNFRAERAKRECLFQPRNPDDGSTTFAARFEEGRSTDLPQTFPFVSVAHAVNTSSEQRESSQKSISESTLTEDSLCGADEADQGTTHLIANSFVVASEKNHRRKRNPKFKIIWSAEDVSHCEGRTSCAVQLADHSR